jgi:sugar O-acyltransferase (sialic acid O-acetyltransferase NeuD family)
MADRLLIIGSGGFATEVCWLAEEAGWDVLGFLDDSPDEVGKLVVNKRVLGPSTSWSEHGPVKLVVAIGSPRTRLKVVENLGRTGRPEYATLIHPNVRRSRFVQIAEGSMVTAGCILTTNISIGKHCILNLNVTVGHDCRFGDFVTIAPLTAISGNVTLGNLVEVGTGAAIRQGLAVADGSVLGMGGVLTKSMESNKVYVGNPAKLLRSID